MTIKDLKQELDRLDLPEDTTVWIEDPGGYWFDINSIYSSYSSHGPGKYHKAILSVRKPSKPPRA